jgi:hypothetical protein
MRISMDTAEICVTLGGIVAIGWVIRYFFTPSK